MFHLFLVSGQVFSVTFSLEKGIELSNFGKEMRLESRRGTGVNILEFHKIFKTDKGYHCGLECEIIENKKDKYKDDILVLLSTSDKKTVDINEIHKLLGHPCENKVKNKCFSMNCILKGEWNTCETFDICKSRRNNLNKDN